MIILEAGEEEMGACYSSIGKRYKGGGGGGCGGGGGGGGATTSIISYSSRNLFGGGENELHRIPQRMFVNGASTVASLFTQQGKKGTNQDAMLVWEVSLPLPHHQIFTKFSHLVAFLSTSLGKFEMTIHLGILHYFSVC